MSPRQDKYTRLCLEQAIKSPLHYRHGCIIVRGGKVIGKGYNHYRPGFNGGALKNGRIASMSFVAESKQKERLKQKQKHIQESEKGENMAASFGGGHLANTPLSMHSEMMAIRSALSLSAHDSGSSARSTSCASKPTSKPCVKRPIELVAGSTPPPRPLHRATSGALNRLHISSPKFQHNVPNRVKEEKEHNTRGYQKEKNRKEKGPHEVQYQYHHESGSNLDMTLDTNDNETSTAFKNSLHSSPPLPRRRTFFSSSGGIDKAGPHKPREHLVTPQPKLVPVGRAGVQATKFSDRKVDSRLRGADLYVVRLALKPPKLPESASKVSRKREKTMSLSSIHSNLSELTLEDTRPSATGSLYDELSHCSRTPSPILEPTSQTTETECATSSRPCYRCISYMHCAGISRVFWTNDKGEWEGGKVRDLVEALEMEDCTGTSSVTSMFVTKHEVLMLRRQMGF